MLRTLALILALASTVLTTHAATVLDASVMVYVPVSAAATDVGSGTIIDSRDGWCLLVTCGHLFRDTPNANLKVRFADGRTAAGTLLRWSLDPDLAVCTVADTPPAVASIASQPPALHQSTTLVGWLRCRAGVVRTIYRHGRNVTIGVGSIEGDSGGGVFNPAGELVGVTWGAEGNDTFAVPLADVQSFVQQVKVREVGCRWVRDANGNCVRICDRQPNTPQPVNPPLAGRGPELLPGPRPSTIDPRLDALTTKVATLEKQLAAVKGCQCAGGVSVDAKIQAAIAAIKFPQPTPPPTINVDAIVAAVEARQQPFYMRVDPRAAYQPVKPGQYVTLPLDRQQPQ